MRDPRFIATHRGGLLAPEHHRQFVAWAADCAQHLITLWQNHSEDERPLQAISAAHAWARDEISVGQARNAAVAAHAAAREQTNATATAMARATAHAAAAAHMADHALAAISYTHRALAISGISPEEEYARQISRAPQHLREIILAGMAHKHGRYSPPP